MRQFLRRVEREWWRERIEECENACNSGRKGELLFADDTTIVGTKEEMDGGVNAMKEVMGRFEERSNDQKEECLDFCMEESESIKSAWVMGGYERGCEYAIAKEREVCGRK